MSAESATRRGEDRMIEIDSSAEEWINLMMCRGAAKKDPELRKIFEERSYPGVVRAADECTDYEDFKRLLAIYSKEEGA